jgi:hypothetical protein
MILSTARALFELTASPRARLYDEYVVDMELAAKDAESASSENLDARSFALEMYGLRSVAVSAAHARPIIEFISFSVAGIRSLNGEFHGANGELDEDEDEEEAEKLLSLLC